MNHWLGWVYDGIGGFSSAVRAEAVCFAVRRTCQSLTWFVISVIFL